MKKSLRRLIYGGLSTVFAASMLVGCAAEKQSTNANEGSNGGSGEGKETVEFLYWAGAGGEEEGFKSLIADFEAKNPGIKVNAQQVPPPNGGDYYTKLQTTMAGSSAPDVFRVQYQKIGEFASQDALLDVTDVIGADKEKYNPSLLTAVTSGGKIYGLPHHTDTIAVFYNKTYLDQLGIKAPEKLEEAWTWDQLLDVAKKIQDKKLADYGIAIGWKETSAYRALPFLYQNNASLINADLTKGNVDTPEAIETFQFLQTLFKNHMSQGNSMKSTEDYNLLFTSGKAGLLINGNWMIPKWEKEMTEYEWGVTYMPQNKGMASDLGGNALAIPANAKHPEAAKKFLAFMGEKENMKKFVEQGLFLPGRTDIEGPFNYAIKDPSMMDKFIQRSTTVPEGLAKTVTSTNFSKMNQAFADALEGLFVQDVAPEQTAKDLNSKLNEILGSK